MVNSKQPHSLVMTFIFRKWIRFPPTFQFHVGDNMLAGGFGSLVAP